MIVKETEGKSRQEEVAGRDHGKRRELMRLLLLLRFCILQKLLNKLFLILTARLNGWTLLFALLAWERQVAANEKSAESSNCKNMRTDFPAGDGVVDDHCEKWEKWDARV